MSPAALHGAPGSAGAGPPPSDPPGVAPGMPQSPPLWAGSSRQARAPRSRGALPGCVCVCECVSTRPSRFAKS